jgi:hypothetical protein
MLVVAFGLSLSGCTPLGALPLENHLPAHASTPCKSNAGKPQTVTTELSEAEKVAMPEDEFWQLIALLHGSNSDAAYARLTAQLATLPVEKLVGFDARMTIALYGLDDECRANWYSTHDPSGLGFVADDDFLYFRGDTVSAGRANWENAIATDTLPWGTVDPLSGGGELLLYVAGNAAHVEFGIGLDAWPAKVQNTIELSYETGSNPDGWRKK